MITEDYKVGIYLRLSREDEKLGESESISNQRDLLLNYIKDNNLFLVDEYVDDGVSGTTFNRAGFNRMIKDCESKKINMIITKDTSRLGRDHIEIGFYVERYFPEHNIRYVAVNDGIDTAINSSANDMLVFKSAFNDMYVKDISNKLRSSLYTKKRNGQFVGAYAPYGYMKDPKDKHKLLINNEEANVVKRIFKMFANGSSLNNICETLTCEQIETPSISKNMNLGVKNIHYGVWATRTVCDILKCPTYIGNLTQCKQKKVNYKSKKRVHNKENSWIVSKGCVPAIIDEDTFNTVQNMFKSNKNRGIRGNGITDKLLLRGLIFCKDCGHTIGFRSHKQNTIKYGEVVRVYGNCNYWAKRKQEHVCTPHSVKYSDIEEIVLCSLKGICKNYIKQNTIESILNNSEKIMQKKQQVKFEIIKIDNLISSINKKIDICYNDKLDGNITLDVYQRMYNNLTLEIQRLKKEKDKYNKMLYDIENNNLINNKLIVHEVEDFLSMKNPSRTLIASLIDKILIDENYNIDIYYKFKLI